MLLKREIYVGHSVNEFNSISECLNKGNIKFIIKTDWHNHNASMGRGPGIGRYATKSVDPTYHIYVRRKDFVRAQEIISHV